MKTPYSDSLDTLIAIITQMAIGKFTHRTAEGLSKDTSIDEATISKTLETFKGLFRKPSKPPSNGLLKYGLHLRYAREQSAGPSKDEDEPTGPLNSEDLTVLLTFVSERANQEAICRSTTWTNWTAIFVAGIAVVTSIFTVAS